VTDSPFKGADQTSEPRFVLVRVDDKNYLVDDTFWYIEPLADRPVGFGSPTETGLSGVSDGEARRFQVPAPGVTFKTDLASIPRPVTWLIPKDGRHTPAALLHDALMPKTPTIYHGPELDRVEADRIFRNAMRHLGVPFLRRWIIWSAVSLATFVGGRPHARTPVQKLAVLMRAASVALVIAGCLFLGASMWADLLDRQWPKLPGLGRWPDVPGMGVQATWAEARDALGLTVAIAAGSGVVASGIRLVSEIVWRGRRSWLRAVAFVALPSVLIPLAVPLLAAAAGWLAFSIVEAIAVIPQVLLRWMAGVVKHFREDTVVLDRFAGPINVPATNRRL